MMHRQQLPQSPSWISIRKNNRSTSLPRIRLDRRDSPSYFEDSSSSRETAGVTVGRVGVRSWAKTFLSGAASAVTKSSTTLSPPTNPLPFRKTASSISRRRRTPVLTLALLKLDEQLTTYCERLKDPSWSNVEAACDLLSRTIATASPTTTSSGSPATPSSNHSLLVVGSPQSPRSPTLMGLSPSSSSRSPIRNWLTRGSELSTSPPTTVSTSAMALEGEWEKIIIPLFLLAGAEAIYASLGHAQSTHIATQLKELYQHIINELDQIREILCDPFLEQQQQQHDDKQQPQQQLQQPQQQPPILAMYYERAVSVANTLHALVNIAQTRCRLIPMQSIMWESSSSIQFGDLNRLLENTILPSIEMEDSKATPMIQALKEETEAWKYLTETAYSLERCRFAETILNCQKIKLRLHRDSSTNLQTWFSQTLQNMISILPIVFDRTQAFAKPFYGFHNAGLVNQESSKERIGGSQQDLEMKVLDFLYKQQKAGTSSVAVTVVVNAQSTSNFRIERGFMVVDSVLDTNTLSELEASLVHWPAVYMRTTKHHGNGVPSVSNGLLVGNKRRSNNNRKDWVGGRPANRSHDDEVPIKSRTSFADQYKRWSADGSSLSSASYANDKDSVQLKVLEYSPDSGDSSSWPHSNWDILIQLLNGTEEEEGDDLVVDNDLPSDGSTNKLEDEGFFKWPNIPKTNLSNTQDLDESESVPNMKKEKKKKNVMKRSVGQTSFFVSSLSDFMWLVVITKEGEESIWHRRKVTIVDDEIVDFLENLSSKLRVRDLFDAVHAQRLCRDVNRKTRAVDLIKTLEEGRNWNDEQIEDFLGALKTAFGLRSVAEPFPIETLKPAYNFRLNIAGSVKRSPKLNYRSRSNVDIDTSAMAFFLGTDLMKAMAARSN